MELTILGSSAAYPSAGAACSGYMIRHNDTTVLLDLGSGVLSNFQRHADLSTLDAVLVTHLHADHFLDLYLLQVYLQFDGLASTPLPLFAPEGSDERINRLQPHAAEVFNRVFDFRPWEAAGSETAGSIVIGELRVSTVVTNHSELCHAVRVEGGRGAEARSVTFTADTGPSVEVERLATGTDLLLAESSWIERPSDGGVGHLAAGDAGAMAKRAQVKRLVLTHLWPGADAALAAALAIKEFGGDVSLATEGTRFVL